MSACCVSICVPFCFRSKYVGSSISTLPWVNHIWAERSRGGELESAMSTAEPVGFIELEQEMCRIRYLRKVGPNPGPFPRHIRYVFPSSNIDGRRRVELALGRTMQLQLLVDTTTRLTPLRGQTKSVKRFCDDRPYVVKQWL